MELFPVFALLCVIKKRLQTCKCVTFDRVSVQLVFGLWFMVKLKSLTTVKNAVLA